MSTVPFASKLSADISLSISLIACSMVEFSFKRSKTVFKPVIFHIDHERRTRAMKLRRKLRNRLSQWSAGGSRGRTGTIGQGDLV